MYWIWKQGYKQWQGVALCNICDDSTEESEVT